ncbi:glyoxalase/bleomycin resistance/extradiol dioxygenase family protein [Streptococcus iniae]|uniref:Glyoxalase n=1 Tax=Streptococcus iniae TaxID=1346 RepID=A0A3L8GFQ5_STRIN|nr:glyoxalase/bleomycin resistance/extradiol dioxygenase family protein [Streptococcus iniae]AGM99283.1 glyoxalase/bleomycin resistance protein/dioxygenase superfamily protein [Streptococcus iniae SF1]AHY16218.1 glyoxalase [Streptococcus iniae]AHY18082.1 glyoxalase [Streptococcus iniae]AJG26373.1 glyoxalase [Streptococcus iniae]APD32252.1 glyoxalase [Streptococcus iniae]
MISKSTTMLYVDDTKAAMTFWTEQMGFVLINSVEAQGYMSYEMAPSADSATKFGLHTKELVAKANPGMNVDFPSLLFETDDLEAEYKSLTEAGVTTNPIMEYQGMVHFTFCDNEGNYIAIRQTN